MVTAGEDDSIHLYNLLSGSMEKVLMSKKHGVAHVAFTHHPQNVVYASRKVGRPAGPTKKLACLCRLRPAPRFSAQMHCRHSAHLISGCPYNILVRAAVSSADTGKQIDLLCCTHPPPRLLPNVLPRCDDGKLRGHRSLVRARCHSVGAGVVSVRRREGRGVPGVPRARRICCATCRCTTTSMCGTSGATLRSSRASPCPPRTTSSCPPPRRARKSPAHASLLPVRHSSSWQHCL